MADTAATNTGRDLLTGRSIQSSQGGSKAVKVNILGKEIQIGCSADAERDLERAAQYVNSNMKESRDRNKTLSVEKIAIVTAINIANDLLKSEGGATGTQGQGVAKKLQTLNAKLDTLLDA